jgi:hypothetical protein
VRQSNYDSNWNLTSVHGVNDDGTSFGNSYNGQDESGGEGAGMDEHAMPDGFPAWVGLIDQNIVPSDGVAARNEDEPHDLPAWIGAIDENTPVNEGIANTGVTSNPHDWLTA